MNNEKDSLKDKLEETELSSAEVTEQSPSENKSESAEPAANDPDVSQNEPEKTELSSADATEQSPSEDKPESAEPEANNPDAPQKKPKDKRMLIAIIAAAVVLVIAVGIALGVAFGDKGFNRLDMPGGLPLAQFTNRDKINNTVKKIKNAQKDRYKEFGIEKDEDVELIQYIYDLLTNNGRSSSSPKSSSSKSGSSDSKASSSSDSSKGTASFSDTFKQTDGVDEADIIKTDGKYIYCVDDSFYINCIDIFSAENGKTEKVAEVLVDGTAITADEADSFYSFSTAHIDEFYLHGDRLIVICDDANYTEETSTDVTRAYVYDISDIKNIKMIGSQSQSGMYVSSRMVGDTLYTVSNYSPYEGAIIPGYGKGMSISELPAENIYCTTLPEDDNFLVISAYNTTDLSAQTDTKAILGYAENLYCGDDNMYLYSTDWYYDDRDSFNVLGLAGTASLDSDVTSQILKVELNDGINLTAYTQVDGEIYDRYAFNENGGNLRVATTSFNYYDWQYTNSIYVLDENLKELGSVSGFAKNDEIKAVKYFDDTAYVMTYTDTDPLFVIDLSNPESPEIPGIIRISGFSDILLPLDEKTVLGIGYHSDSRSGSLFGDSGTRLELFDISDKTHPRLTDSKSYVDYYSAVQENPKALVYNPERNDYLIPLNYERYASWFPEAGAETQDKLIGGTLSFKVKDGKIAEPDLDQADCESVDRCVYIGDYVYMSCYKDGQLSLLANRYDQ